MFMINLFLASNSREHFRCAIVFSFDLEIHISTTTLSYNHFENYFCGPKTPENTTTDIRIVKIALWATEICRLHLPVAGHLGFGPLMSLKGVHETLNPMRFLLFHP